LIRDTVFSIVSFTIWILAKLSSSELQRDGHGRRVPMDSFVYPAAFGTGQSKARHALAT
jgi:hypothetical protein